MTKPITISELKKELKIMNMSELNELILDLYKSSNQVKEILSLFEMIYRNTDNLDVLQEKSIQKKASILEQKDLFISDIESIYNEE